MNHSYIVFELPLKNSGTTNNNFVMFSPAAHDGVFCWFASCCIFISADFTNSGACFEMISLSIFFICAGKVFYKMNPLESLLFSY